MSTRHRAYRPASGGGHDPLPARGAAATGSMGTPGAPSSPRAASPGAARVRAVRRALAACGRRAVAALAIVAVGTLAAPGVHASRLLVSSALNNSILRFDGQSGAFTDLFAPPSSGLSFPDGLAIGPDGNAYVRSSGNVLRFSATTGAFIDTFASGGAQSSDPRSFQLRFDPGTGALVSAPAASGLDGPTGLTFGPDGNLYVSSFGSVLRYNGQNGQSTGTFASGGGLGNATGVAFGPDGNLYVSSFPGSAVLQYDGRTGAFKSTFVAAGSGGLARPIGLTFGPDHNLYVCDYNQNAVLQYNGANGTFIKTFTSGGGLSGPTNLVFGIDGNLYVSNYGSSSVAVFNGTNGAFINYFVASGLDGLSGPFGLSFQIEAPTNLVATVQSAGEIDLAWANNSPDATAVEIDRKMGTGVYQVVASLNANITNYQDRGVSENTSYTYRVRVTNDAAPDSAFSNEAGGTTPLNPPAAPANLTVVVLSGASASTGLGLSWQNNSTTQTNLIIERKTGNGAYAPVATIDGQQIGYVDNGLTANTTYTYHIRAINSAGSSLWSNEASGSTQGVPGTPLNLTATASSGTEIDLAWVDADNIQAGFVVQRKTLGGSYSQIATLPANATSYQDTSAAPNTTYTYQVAAQNSVGTSLWSNEASATSPGPPATPTGLTASAISGTQVTLNWTNGGSNQTQIDLLRKLNGGLYVPVATLPGSATSYSDANLTPNTAYTYIIRADNAVGPSGWSNEPSVTTLGAPSAPTNLAATAGSGQVALSWTASSGTVFGYAIWRLDASQVWTRIYVVAPSVTSFTDQAVSANATYTYRVRATNDAGASDWSNTVTATPGP